MPAANIVQQNQTVRTNEDILLEVLNTVRSFERRITDIESSNKSNTLFYNEDEMMKTIYDYIIHQTDKGFSLASIRVSIKQFIANAKLSNENYERALQFLNNYYGNRKESKESSN